MQKTSRVAVINDISGFGKCAAAISLPVLSATGAEVSVLPTALLSTHTGGFKGYTYKDLTEEMRGISAHWQKLGLKFDAVYSGYLANTEQIDIALELLDSLKSKNGIAVVDPTMGDNGRLYSGFKSDFAEKMLQLCCKADIILPNLTEAALLLGEKYPAKPHSENVVKNMAQKLWRKTGATVVVTGVEMEENNVSTIVYDGEYFCYTTDKIQGHYHGTGDVFASTFVGSLMVDESDVKKAVKLAADFTKECVWATMNAGDEPKFGLKFEQCLPNLIEAMKN